MQVTSFFARNKPKRKSEAVAEPAPPAEASSLPSDADAQPMDVDQPAGNVADNAAARVVITLSDDEASSSGPAPAAKRLKSAGSGANAPPAEPAAAQLAGQQQAAKQEQPAEPAADQPAKSAQQAAVPQPYTPESGQQAAPAATPTTGSPAEQATAGSGDGGRNGTAGATSCSPSQVTPPAAGDAVPTASGSNASTAQLAGPASFVAATQAAVPTLLGGNAPSPRSRNALAEQYCVQIGALQESLRAQGPLQALPQAGESHAFSKAQV